jgi:hypothetical protein
MAATLPRPVPLAVNFDNIPGTGRDGRMS